MANTTSFRFCFTLLRFTSISVVLSGVQFSLESQVEDVVKAAGKDKRMMAGGIPNVAAMLTPDNQVQDQGVVSTKDSFSNSETDMNRSKRRMQQRLGTDKDKK
jgi:hypothetical protein